MTKQPLGSIVGGNMKKLKTIKLGRLETRFILNLVLGESNEMHHPDGHRLSRTNIHNVKGRKDYKRKMRTLLNKIQLLDRSFYD